MTTRLTDKERAALQEGWGKARGEIFRTDPMDMAGQGFEAGWLAGRAFTAQEVEGLREMLSKLTQAVVDIMAARAALDEARQNDSVIPSSAVTDATVERAAARLNVEASQRLGRHFSDEEAAFIARMILCDVAALSNSEEREKLASELRPHIAQAQEDVRAKGLCGAVYDHPERGEAICIRDPHGGPCDSEEPS